MIPYPGGWSRPAHRAGGAASHPTSVDRVGDNRVMDAHTWWNLALVLVFVLVGGVFAATEFALVSLRESQLAQLEEKGPRGARVAKVARDPNRFLAAVQIGVTVAGFLSAAYGASTLAPDFAPVLESWGLSASASRTVALLVLTLLIAYLSLVLGELVPKRLALQRTSQVALAVGPTLDRFATLMRPVIWLLGKSTNGVVRLLGGDPTARSEEMTEEELREVVMAHEGLPDDERRLLGDVLTSSDRPVVEAMRPRGEVVFLPGSMSVPDAARLVRDQPYSRYPVTGEDFDDVLGFVHVRDLFDAVVDHDTGREPAATGGTVADRARAVIQLPGTAAVLPSLTLMRSRGVHLAVVVDEYGGTDGIVTLEDLVEELVGDIRDEYDPVEALPDLGSVPASLTLEEFAERTGVELEDGPYETVAGYVLARLGRLAVPGDTVDVPGASEDDAPAARLTVTDVDGRRIRRVGVAKPHQA